MKQLFQPQNLVMMGDFPDCDVKVCDFEISRVIVEGTEIREILGTPEYVGECVLQFNYFYCFDLDKEQKQSSILGGGE